MTIRQQGGVFGRNPAFNDVEAQTIEVTDISLPDGGEASFGNSNDLKIYHDGSNSYIKENGVGSLLIYGSNLRLGNSDGSKLYLLANSGDKTDIYFDGAVKIRTQSTGAQIFGDLAFSSGNGIDFSATSGTGTSELFDDYEEGTWTPEITGTSTAGTIAYNAQHGYYTKIGRLVQVEFYVQWNSGTGTGNLQVTGLPFTAGNNLTQPGLAIGDIENVALTALNIATLAVASNSTNINVRQVPTGGGGSSPVPYDAAGYIKASGVYSV